MKVALGTHQVMGSDAMNDSLSQVIAEIHRRRLDRNLMAVISDCCPGVPSALGRESSPE
ncbi:GL21102 [Drosophila persimilis]|uniref:GL21102 n=1 Tax=Drosophila persimilis TaxID=7234 RepID=B4GWX1_DROPE|nr:GL21102 [Drosophila persimilis]